jgi:hypothetical protein
MLRHYGNKSDSECSFRNSSDSSYTGDSSEDSSEGSIERSVHDSEEDEYDEQADISQPAGNANQPKKNITTRAEYLLAKLELNSFERIKVIKKLEENKLREEGYSVTNGVIDGVLSTHSLYHKSDEND